jgi:hypothetical protein
MIDGFKLKMGPVWAAARGFVVILMVGLIFGSCTRSESKPDRQQAKAFVEGRLRRIGTPINNLKFKKEYSVQVSGYIFQCFDWEAELVWNYPKAGGIEKLYGYARFVKADHGWEADHLNYKYFSDGIDPNLKCEHTGTKNKLATTSQ